MLGGVIISKITQCSIASNSASWPSYLQLSHFFECVLQDLGPASVDTPDHRQVALEAAHQMIVLLKNDNDLLPLDSKKVSITKVIVFVIRGVKIDKQSSNLK